MLNPSFDLMGQSQMTKSLAWAHEEALILQAVLSSCVDAQDSDQSALS